MSSSLFADCYIKYDIPPTITTADVDGDRKIGELINGDTLYILCRQKLVYAIKELKVCNSMHKHNGKWYITCIDDKNKTTSIYLGLVNYGSYEPTCKKSSIVLFNGDIVGTNKKSILDYKRRSLQDSAKHLMEEYKARMSWVQQEMRSLPNNG